MASEPQYQPALRPTTSPKKRKLKYDKFIFLLALVIVLPSTALAEILLWLSGASILQTQVIRPLQTLSNMVASIREDDFSFRVRGASREDSLADLIHELNTLADRMQQQKTSALEATALLKKVLMEIDVAVFTFDQQQQLRIVNRAGEQLMSRI